jgi:hypothetical protein
MSGTDERIGDELILERMYAAEQVLLSQADALDMKASYLLVALVFLAQLSTTFLLIPNLAYCGKTMQWISCFLLTVAGVFLLLELRIEKFRTEDAVHLETWRDTVINDAKKRKEYTASSHPDEYLRSRLVWGLIEGSKPRIARGEENNKKKVHCLRWAYGLTFAAFLLDILFMTRLLY